MAALKPLSTLQNPTTTYAYLKSFLILWKQLEVFKEAWGRLKLGVEDINTVSLQKQFSSLYRAEILYPAMKAIARQLNQEANYEGLVTDTHPMYPPKGASEVEIRTQQLHRILESFESHMICEMQRKVAKEMTLVISERAREDTGLPTELWKHPVMKENFSSVRPQIIENFVQKLMERHQDTKEEITFRKDHLHKCLTSLACDVMARERSNFETYSMFYEHVLRQEHQLLYQKEQEMKAMEDSQMHSEGPHGQIADLSHEMIVEITALRAKLSDLEEENQNLKEEIRKEVQNEYETLVRNLFMACFNLKSKLDEYRIDLNRQVYELINEVRKEGVENMIVLKKKIGSTKDDEALKGNLARLEQLQALRDENNRLEKLVCKLKALGCWKQTVKEERLYRQLADLEREAVKNKKDCLSVKMIAEEEVILLRQQLVAVRKALAQSQSEYEKMKQQLVKQRQLLKEVKHRASQECRSRQQLDGMKAACIERLLEDMEEKEHRLRTLTDEFEKSSKMSQLQQNKTEKEIKQIKSQLSQERNLKWDAFQRVDELQSQVYDVEATFSQRSSSLGLRKKSISLLSPSASSIRTTLKGSTFLSHSVSAMAKGHQQSFMPEAIDNDGIGVNGTDVWIQRPKTVPSRLKNKLVEAGLADADHSSLITQLQELRLTQK
ncbi:coiled-coil domain-containing protein 162 [Latimeria chalumnae]|uniref:coiled-coil domain-containing protein 162 n=1 Tax=Latimeria chalumnae TaxID=7897 RepID=UPI00313CB7C7